MAQSATLQHILDDPNAPRLDAGAAIQKRRKEMRRREPWQNQKTKAWSDKGYSMRDLEEELNRVAALEPHRFAPYSRQTQLKIEKGGANYLRYQIDSEKKVLALIEVLYGGNITAFENDTGILFEEIRAHRRHVLHWSEGDKRFGTGQAPSSRKPPLPAELVFEATSEDMAPILVPGQQVGVVVPMFPEDMVNQLVIINHPERGLIAAIAKDLTTFYQLRGDPFTTPLRSVVGFAFWVGSRPIQ